MSEKKKTDYLVLVNVENGVPDGFDDTVEMVYADNGFGMVYSVEKKTYEAFLSLREELLKNDGIRTELISACRSKEEQEETFKRYIDNFGLEYAKKYVAVPGCSEHQTGLAIDVGIVIGGKLIRTVDELLEAESLFKIIQRKLPDYGFILRYPKDKEAITKIAYESWHFRYIDSPEIAKEITDKGICFEEYWEKRSNG